MGKSSMANERAQRHRGGLATTDEQCGGQSQAQERTLSHDLIAAMPTTPAHAACCNGLEPNKLTVDSDSELQ